MKFRPLLLVFVLILIVGSIFYLESQKGPIDSGESVDADVAISIDTMTAEQKAQTYEPAKEIVSPAGFINTDDITIQELIGEKVILVDFWTYSCINCQRTTPYLNAWYDKYRDQGLEIIGIHTPEFEFEKEYDNVVAAVEKFGIEYPVVLDNDYGTWRAYGNRYWPRKYLIDIDGFIVYDHIGEGAYDTTEMMIQDLLEERAVRLGLEEMEVSGGLSEPEEVVVRAEGRLSPEIYFGANRNEQFENPPAFAVTEGVFERPTGVDLNQVYLVNDWAVEDEYAESRGGDSTILFHYNAQNVYFVAGAEEGAVEMTVLVDGEPVGDLSGGDVVGGQVTITDERLYHLISDPGGVNEHTLELMIEGQGVRAYTFTFG